MTNLKKFFCAFLPLSVLFALTTTLPAFADVSVNSPSNGASVGSSFNLSANSYSCSSQDISAMGYSLDSSPNTTIIYDTSINAQVQSPTGWHVVHVKAWGNQGSACDTDIWVNVSGGAASVVPSNAVSVSAIQTFNNWVSEHDAGTPGSSYGTTSMQSSPSLTGAARLFANQFNYFGGERYSVQFDDDQYSQNFFYDTWVYIANDANGFANLEFDLNQTMSNGETVIMGFQCDGWSSTWDYTANAGSADQPTDTWLHSYSPCNVHSWGANQWHHLQIYFSHDDSGWVTYHSVWLDGAEQDLNFTVFSGFNLGWSSAEVANFQIDGNNGGTSWGNIYLDQMTVYRW